MNRAAAIRTIVERHPEAAIIFSNGLTSREGSFVADRPGNFYLLHAMGEALSVGIGLRMAQPDLEVVVVDGDGNAVMGMAACSLLPIEGLHYYILCNNIYETTGSQDTPALNMEYPTIKKINIEKGTISAPLPPEPKQIISKFMDWLHKKKRNKKA